MAERQGAVTFKGNPLTLVGDQVGQGDNLPDVSLLGTDLSETSLGSFKGKTVVLSSVPSLDTSVCSTETKRLNEEAGRLSDNVQFVTVSMDLPFAQQRWLDSNGVENVTTLSDHMDGEFGRKMGVLIKELRLLARAVWVVDGNGKVRYEQLVKEVADEPDYDEVLEAVKKLA